MDELIVKDIRTIYGNTIVTLKCTNCGLEETYNISYKPLPTKGSWFCYICKKEHKYPKVVIDNDDST